MKSPPSPSLFLPLLKNRIEDFRFLPPSSPSAESLSRSILPPFWKKTGWLPFSFSLLVTLQDDAGKECAPVSSFLFSFSPSILPAVVPFSPPLSHRGKKERFFLPPSPPARRRDGGAIGFFFPFLLLLPSTPKQRSLFPPFPIFLAKKEGELGLPSFLLLFLGNW